MLTQAAVVVVAPLILKMATFDFERDFESIAAVANTPMLFVANVDKGPKTMAEMIAKAKAKPRKTTPSNSSTSSDEESDDSNTSRDSILKPKKTVKGKGQQGKKGKALPLPPRKATWRSASDLPHAIRENIRSTYSHFQFSKIMDHQVRSCLGNLNQSYWVKLLANSVGRCTVDAINLIKLVYDGERKRPTYASPARVHPDAD
jgi:hypothetical protein